MIVQEYEKYNEAEILDLYESVGWSNYTARPEMLREAYAHSLCVLAAREGGELAGVIRAVGDGHSIVYIQDLLVAPRFQRRGIGRALMEALLQRYGDVYQVVLMTDDRPETLAFYEAVGLSRAETLGCRLMLRMR